MRITIDSAGRIVIPKQLREAAGIRPASEVEVSLRDRRIEIEPVEATAHIERVGHFNVIVFDEVNEPWDFDLDAEREEMERERIGL